MSKAKRSVITGKPVTKRVPLPAGGVRIDTFIPWTLVKRGVRRQVTTPNEGPAEFREEVRRAKLQLDSKPHSPLLRALGLAHYWQQLLDDGKFRSITELAAAEGIDTAQACRVLRLAQLSPKVTASMFRDQVPLGETLRGKRSLSWDRQSSADKHFPGPGSPRRGVRASSKVHLEN